MAAVLAPFRPWPRALGCFWARGRHRNSLGFAHGVPRADHAPVAVFPPIPVQPPSPCSALRRAGPRNTPLAKGPLAPELRPLHPAWTRLGHLPTHCGSEKPPSPPRCPLPRDLSHPPPPAWKLATPCTLLSPRNAPHPKPMAAALPEAPSSCPLPLPLSGSLQPVPRLPMSPGAPRTAALYLHLHLLMSSDLRNKTGPATSPSAPAHLPFPVQLPEKGLHGLVSAPCIPSHLLGQGRSPGLLCPRWPCSAPPCGPPLPSGQVSLLPAALCSASSGPRSPPGSS